MSAFYKFLFFILFGLYSVLYLFSNSQPTYFQVQLMGVAAIFQLSLSILIWTKETGTPMSAYTIFLVALYAFTLGQAMLEPFGLVYEERSLLANQFKWGVSLKSFFDATYYTLLFCFFFHLGALSNKSISFFNESEFDSFGNETYKQMSSIKFIALRLLFFSLPFFLYETIYNMVVVSSLGYLGVYEQGQSNRLVSILSELYPVSVFCLVYTSEYFKQNRLLFYGVALVSIFLPPLYIGGRSESMICFGLLGLIYALFNSVNKRVIVVSAICIYCLFFIFNLVLHSRTTSNRDLSNYTTIAKEEISNPLFGTLSEMGWSMYPMTQCVQIFPYSEDYKYGDSYFYSILTIVPNLGFWTVHPSKAHVSLGDWLQEYRGLWSGPGFSMPAEAYYNFGPYGLIVMFLLGYLYSGIYFYADKKGVQKDAIKAIIAIVILWLTIKTVRNSFNFTVRAFVFYAIPIYMAMKYKYNEISNKSLL